MGKWEEGNYTFPLFHNYTITQSYLAFIGQLAR